MIVVSGGDDQHILEVSFLDRPRQLLPLRQLLQLLLGHAERQVDDLALPHVIRPVQRLDDRLDLAHPRGPNTSAEIELHRRRLRQDDVGHGGAMRRALVAVVGQGLGAVGSEDAAFDALESGSMLRFEDSPFDAAVDHADGDSFAVGADHAAAVRA